MILGGLAQARSRRTADRLTDVPHVCASATDALDSAVSPSDRQSRLWLASVLKRAIRFATYDWTRELPLSLRVITMIGMGIQGYAIWAGLSRSLIWPIMWPSGVTLYATILLIDYIGFCIQNATLASALIRKTELESSSSRLRRFRRPCNQPR